MKGLKASLRFMGNFIDCQRGILSVWVILFSTDERKLPAGELVFWCVEAGVSYAACEAPSTASHPLSGDEGLVKINSRSPPVRRGTEGEKVKAPPLESAAM
jgi:hypothetical protein